MTDNPHEPSPEQIEAAKQAARRFLDQVADVPEDEREPLSDQKFVGPIGRPDGRATSEQEEQTDD